jgi:hypothetical protein
MMSWSLYGTTYQWSMNPDRESAEELANKMIPLLQEWVAVVGNAQETTT